MKIQEVIDWINAFAPTGDEAEDEMALYDFTDAIGEAKMDPRVREALISIFERYPEADLGSPGPIVHCLEESPIADHSRLVSRSLRRRPTVMTVWMAERCLRSKPDDVIRDQLIDALRNAQNRSDSDVVQAVVEALENYGA